MKKSKLTIVILSLAFLFGGINTNISSINVELSFDKTIKKADSTTGDAATSSLLFGTANKINSSSLSVTDSSNHTWNINSTGITFENASENGESYSLIKFDDETEEKSVVLECDLKSYVNVSKFSLKLGGIEGSKGNVSIKLDGQELVNGNLNGTDDVTLSCTEKFKGSKLVISIDNIINAVKIYSIGYSYISFTNEEGAYAISLLNTKAQLKYSFNVNQDNSIDFVTMKMNFGAIILKNDVEKLADSKVKEITKYGVAVAQKSNLGTSISEALKAKSEYVSVVSANFDGVSKMQTTNENGTATSGNYIIFNADLTFKDPAYFNTEISAVAYFLLKDGSYVFLQERSCSVSSLAQEYVNSDSFKGFSTVIQDSLKALTNGNGQIK